MLHQACKAETMKGSAVDKESLSERDICTKIIAPAIRQAGRSVQRQVREEVTFTKGRAIVRGKRYTRGQARRSDLVLHQQNNLPIAMIEANGSAAAARQMHAQLPKTVIAQAVPA
jgi:type I site-specific restriction endonuclease